MIESMQQKLGCGYAAAIDLVVSEIEFHFNESSGAGGSLDNGGIPV